MQLKANTFKKESAHVRKDSILKILMTMTMVKLLMRQQSSDCYLEKKDRKALFDKDILQGKQRKRNTRKNKNNEHKPYCKFPIHCHPLKEKKKGKQQDNLNILEYKQESNEGKFSNAARIDIKDIYHSEDICFHGAPISGNRMAMPFIFFCIRTYVACRLARGSRILVPPLYVCPI